jgi:hypothetical protein
MIGKERLLQRTDLLPRREFLIRLLAGVGGLLILSSTPASGEERDPTPSHIEGPYYKAKSPQRSNLVEQGMEGTRLLLSGRVLSTKGSDFVLDLGR